MQNAIAHTAMAGFGASLLRLCRDLFGSDSAAAVSLTAVTGAVRRSVTTVTGAVRRSVTTVTGAVRRNVTPAPIALSAVPRVPGFPRHPDSSGPQFIRIIGHQDHWSSGSLVIRIIGLQLIKHPPIAPLRTPHSPLCTLHAIRPSSTHRSRLSSSSGPSHCFKQAVSRSSP